MPNPPTRPDLAGFEADVERLGPDDDAEYFSASDIDVLVKYARRLESDLAALKAERDLLENIEHWSRSVVECHPDFRGARLRDLATALAEKEPSDA